MVEVLRGRKPNPFYQYFIVGLCTTFHNVMCDINITPHLCLVRGVVFQGITPYGVVRYTLGHH